MTSVIKIASTALNELAEVILNVDENSVNALLDAICGAKSVYVAGSGRSLLMLKCFAMRLMHIDISCHIVGDVTTPAFAPDDLIIIASGSGETAFPLTVAKKANEIGGKTALITANKNSSIGRISDVVLIIPAYTDKIPDCGAKKPVLPTASQFEEALLLLTDSMILPLGARKGVPTDGFFVRHANLE